MKILGSVVMAAMMAASDCDGATTAEPKSASGVTKATVKVAVGTDGLTTEQRNIQERYKLDNQPGSIKHLYVISAYSGQVLIYSTVRGKVTSSGKRLTPKTVAALDGQYTDAEHNGFPVDFPAARGTGTQAKRTSEVLQDDGTYGDSVEYLYWFDERGAYHQHYVSGGQILHISDQPIATKSIVLNLEIKK